MNENDTLALERRLSSVSKINSKNISKKDIESKVDVYQYYTGDDNYKDDIPFDLYNMVELARRVAKPYTIPKVSELNSNDERIMNNLNNNRRKSIHSSISKVKNKETINEMNIINDPLKYMHKKNHFDTLPETSSKII